MVPPLPEPSPDEEEVREVVPARAVLTELARGFLLVRESDRERAVRFAVTFLREQTDQQTRPIPAFEARTAPAQQQWRRAPHGAVERPDLRGTGGSNGSPSCRMAR